MLKPLQTLSLILLCSPLLWQSAAWSAENAVAIPAPIIDAPQSSSNGLQTAVLAGGCFWGVQAVFQHVNGVSKVVSGYSGGASKTADYNSVSTGATGHAEAVEIRFDPKAISYGKILQIYFSVAHDPTELNRQGPDTGTQYRSEIFATDEQQRHLAENYIAQLDKAGVFRRKIATQVDLLSAFYPAESYHQDYATLHPENPYILINDLPKVKNLQQMFPELYRVQPVLMTAAHRSH